MAIRREARNGTIVKFPDGTSEEVITKYLALQKYKINKGKNHRFLQLSSRRHRFASSRPRMGRGQEVFG